MRYGFTARQYQPVANVRSYVGNLVGSSNHWNPAGSWIARRNLSYTSQLRPDELDLIAFQLLVKEGCSGLQERDLAAAAVRFRSALAEWRGAMVVGLCRGSLLAARCVAVEESGGR